MKVFEVMFTFTLKVEVLANRALANITKITGYISADYLDLSNSIYLRIL